jgi:2-phosphosulfolactate phosphatase
MKIKKNNYKMEENNIKIIIASDGCEEAKGICVVFDVLRASSVECHLHLVGAKKVFPQESVEETLEMKKKNKDAILLGERDGEKIEGFDFGNSQSEILANADKIKNKICYHNTTAGTQAINKCVDNKNVKEVLVASPNNFEATLSYLKKFENKEFITLVAAGSLDYCLEDFLICEYFKSLLLGEKPKLSMEEIISKVKETTGAKFFKNIYYYPSVDFDLAFKLNVLNKALKVVGDETVSIDVN